MRISIKSFWPATAGLIVATVLFCLPGEEFPKRDWFSRIYLDKWVHAGLFAGLVTLWSLPFIHRIRETQRLYYTFRWVAVTLLLYGIIIEFIQLNFIAYRTLGVDDMVADALGCGIGLWFVSRQQKNQKPFRKDPFKNRDFIPVSVRPYFVKKVCFYGPESTGKSTMTIRVAEHYQTTFVPEVAREMITSNKFTAEDIVRIGQAYRERVTDRLPNANRILFCDTDFITTQIYSNHYLGTVPPVLYLWEEQLAFDHYFLFDIDTPWVADGLRDLGDQREVMFLTFQQELEKRGITYTLLSGSWEQKFDRIRTVVDALTGM